MSRVTRLEITRCLCSARRSKARLVRHKDRQGKDQQEEAHRVIHLHCLGRGDAIPVRLGEADEQAEAPQEAQAGLQGMQLAEDLQGPQTRPLHVRGSGGELRRARRSCRHQEVQDLSAPKSGNGDVQRGRVVARRRPGFGEVGSGLIGRAARAPRHKRRREHGRERRARYSAQVIPGGMSVCS